MSLPENYMGKTIRDLNVRKNWGANIVGFKTLEGDYVFNPLPGTVIIPKSKLFVLGTNEQITAMKNAITA